MLSIKIILSNNIAGCIGKKKAKFFQRLFSSLISDWILTVGEDLVDNSVTNKDKAVHWKFEQLDVNKNGVCGLLYNNHRYCYWGLQC